MVINNDRLHTIHQTYSIGYWDISKKLIIYLDISKASEKNQNI